MKNQKPKTIEENLEYVKKEFNKLLNLYRNKYILVHNQEVISSFDTYEAAADEGVRLYGIDGNFLVYYVAETVPVNFVISAKL